jgi:hypothetical protein
MTRFTHIHQRVVCIGQSGANGPRLTRLSSAQYHAACINGSVKSHQQIGALCQAAETPLAPDFAFSARCGSVQFGRMK